MDDLKEWISCPECGPKTNVHVQSWSYGFQAECDSCNDVFYYEI